MPRARRFVLDLGDEAHTLALAAALARVVPAGGEIHLIGDLAAGKTAFARGFLRALGHRGAVKSPTFTLVESYEFAPGQAEGRPELRAVHHFDLYRLGDVDELEAIGYRDFVGTDGVALFEWADRVPSAIPAGGIWVVIEDSGPGNERRISITAGRPRAGAS